MKIILPMKSGYFPSYIFNKLESYRLVFFKNDSDKSVSLKFEFDKFVQHNTLYYN